MEFSTAYIWFLASHVVLAFCISLLVLSCPFRFFGEKFGLFLLTWLVPFFGPIFVRYRLGELGSLTSHSSSDGSCISNGVESSPNRSGTSGSSD
ncbi:hypothetical protein Sps_01921 [Shewanella psychrophila]|uniref:Uncharacterized protein n=1 Tax=Shewanella psychrophila TaxID=225848 RepID=A0A1S6HNG7_9GAMM|nr:hypothetical protein [Shewanella psychrophila]AQS37081.1 hypothetical protein Sps_01921 [Shewanella psychrophila]